MATPEEFETLDKILQDRWSCRGYLPEEIDQETIEQIVRSAQKVPSWCNAQPWQILICGPQETNTLRDKIYGLPAQRPHSSDIPFPTQYAGTFLARRRACGIQLYQSVGITRENKEGAAKQAAENFRFFGAPHIAIITTEKDLGPYSLVDCGAFVSAFALAAQAKGIGTIAQAAIARVSDVVRDHFQIPEHRQVVCAISFGRPDLDHPANSFRTARAPLEEVIEWHWAGSKQDAAE
ncbi:nitroreductase [Rhodovibrionaceae bacterium A322]